MPVFIRRFTQDPGNEVLLEIESVNILDLEPPGSISGVGSGTACLVGEFEDGPFEQAVEVANTTDLVQTFGGFGFEYAGVPANHPCARRRQADGAVIPEYWNGNAMVALNGKRFRRLVVCRADTSVGEVQLSRQAYLLGGKLFSYALSSGDQILADRGAGIGAITATFTGVVATLTSAAGTYPSTFVGGETMTIVQDGRTVTVVFQSSDQTQAQVIARINAAMGYAAAVDVGGSVTDLSGRVAGTSGSIEITAASALVLTATGFSLSSATGTGNVADISQVTPTEVNVVVSTASAGNIRVQQLDDGTLRMVNFATPTLGILRITGGAAAAALGFQETQAAGYQDSPKSIAILSLDAAVATATGFSVTTGRPVISSGAGSYPSGFAGGEQMVVQVEGEGPVQVVFDAADQTQVQVLARINLALGYAAAQPQTATRSSLAGPGTKSTSIPAGTLVANSSGAQWVTMQSLSVSPELTDGLLVKVRPAADDGTATGAAPGTVTGFGRLVQDVSWSVTNPLALSAALTEPQIDAAYVAALDATLSSTDVSAEVNLIWSARQSNAVRGALKQNALDASSGGLLGRVAVIRPPLGTPRSVARSGASQPGVGAYRSDRVIYVFPGVQTFVPAIARRGLSGGDGFTADGVVDTGADGFLVSVCSQLPPEENPGQLTQFAAGAIGIESGNSDVRNLTINDYIAFKAAGICAPRMDSGVMIFQSGVTSVDPQLQPSLKNIARRRMADFIQDSLARRLKRFGKQLNTRSRRTQIVGEIRAFLLALQSPQNASAQRIEGFLLDLASGNTPATLAQGLFRIILNVRTLSDLGSIALATTIGEQVEVSEAA